MPFFFCPGDLFTSLSGGDRVLEQSPPGVLQAPLQVRGLPQTKAPLSPSSCSPEYLTASLTFLFCVLITRCLGAPPHSLLSAQTHTSPPCDQPHPELTVSCQGSWAVCSWGVRLFGCLLQPSRLSLRRSHAHSWDGLGSK